VLVTPPAHSPSDELDTRNLEEPKEHESVTSFLGSFDIDPADLKNFDLHTPTLEVTEFCLNTINERLWTMNLPIFRLQNELEKLG
jgi:hypothetical protein